jgi:hypothetical protein
MVANGWLIVAVHVGACLCNSVCVRVCTRKTRYMRGLMATHVLACSWVAVFTCVRVCLRACRLHECAPGCPRARPCAEGLGGRWEGGWAAARSRDCARARVQQSLRMRTRTCRRTNMSTACQACFSRVSTEGLTLQIRYDTALRKCKKGGCLKIIRRFIEDVSAGTGQCVV